MEFKELAELLLSSAPRLLSSWFPAGRVVGREFCIGNLAGEPGDSLRFNLDKGFGKDFETDEAFGDIIALYAKMRGLSMGESASELGAIVGYQVSKKRPPAVASTPDFTGATAVYPYKSRDGAILFYVARYDRDGKKTFTPYTWNQDRGAWERKAWQGKRPLFGLETLVDGPVMVVEGEKACLAARSFVGVPVVTWSNGANAVDKSEWSPLYGRAVTIWPDADAAGRKAASQLAAVLYARGSSVTVIDTRGEPEGWDAADSGFDAERYAAWVESRRVKYSEEVAPKSQFAIWKELDLSLDSKGQPRQNEDNIARILDKWKPFAGKFFYDEYSGFPYFGDRRIEDSDISHIQIEAQRHIGLHKISPKIVLNGLNIHIRSNIRNLAKEFIEQETWDGIERVEAFFSHYMEVKLSDYSCAVSKNFWISLVARIYQPGCQVDNMVILEGPEGVGKTTALTIIGGAHYVHMNESIGTKDFFQNLAGKFLAEIAELTSFKKAEIKKIIATISNRIDTYRVSYGHFAADKRRKCIFVGTTNEDLYLKEGMGLRRFWPILCGHVDLEGIAKDRCQLFAEARFLLQKGEKWWVVPTTALSEAEERVEKDDWVEIIGEKYISANELTIPVVAREALGIEAAKLEERTIKRIASCLKMLGFRRYSTTKHGVRVRVWKK